MRDEGELVQSPFGLFQETLHVATSALLDHSDVFRIFNGLQ